MFKQKDQKILTNKEDVKKRCKKYFRVLFNEKILRKNQDEIKWNEGFRN